MSNVNCYFHSEIQTMVDMQKFKKQYQKWNPRTKLENGLTVAMYSKSANDRWSHDTCQIDSLFELMDIKMDEQHSLRGISPCTLETPVLNYSCSPPPGRGRLVEPSSFQPDDNDKGNKKFKKLWHIFRKSTKEYYQPQEQSDASSVVEPQVITAYNGASETQLQLQTTGRLSVHYSQHKTHRNHRTSHYRNILKGDISTTTC
ncbi:HEL335Wp [Eremothecium sinecaudum]|uniref:HEL335Wp n=1 Tax=Eremothecium sinecaudum TaxID=45286 RepID=A0A0X8HT27_9SACH|nr:HEL335Wp [Eremothecium sinecaudum]AMD20946.1 HEL335Wp [Eremothecium sinecaudum]